MEIPVDPGVIATRRLAAVTRDGGQPLSENRRAADDLDPWIGRLVAAKIPTMPDTVISCGMVNDLAYVRSIFGARWTATSKEGRKQYEDQVLLFGPHSKFMPLTCEGHVFSAGFGLRAGALFALTGRSCADMLDRIAPEDTFGLLQDDLREIHSGDHSPAEWTLAMEEAMRRFIAKNDPPPPDPVSTAFELQAFRDPNISPADFAEEQGIALRTLERTVRRDFGIPPKRVLRRARALDLAALLCGVADDAEEDELMLRYFDQSHLIREFSAFFGVTPKKFRSKPRPLLTIVLEQRQARRLEELGRLDEGAKRPWI